MSAPYTEQDLRRSIKEVAAAGQGVLDAHQAFAAAVGKYLGIRAEINGDPPGMTPLVLQVDAIIDGPTNAYNAIVDVLQSAP